MLTDEQLQQVYEQIDQGIPKTQIAKNLGIEHKYLLYCLNRANPLRIKINNALIVANQLFYPESIKEMIKKAKTEYEIDKALITGRKRL